MNIHEERLRRLIRDTVHETLTNLGFDLEQQREAQADMIYLRNERERDEELKRKLRTTTLGIAVSTALYMLWVAVQKLLKG